MTRETKNLSIKSVDEIKGILDTINTEEYSLVNYVWTEYGFYPTYLNELFREFFEDVKGPILGFCFPGQEVFYEGKVDILVSLEGFLDTNDAIKSLEETSKILTSKIKSYLEEDDISKKNMKKFNEQLIALEKSFISDKGMYFGAWYKSIYASSDPFSGYGAWILPGLEYEIALKSSERLKEWDSRYSNAINSLESKMKNLIQEIN